MANSPLTKTPEFAKLQPKLLVWDHVGETLAQGNVLLESLKMYKQKKSTLKRDLDALQADFATVEQKIRDTWELKIKKLKDLLKEIEAIELDAVAVAEHNGTRAAKAEEIRILLTEIDNEVEPDS
ncbi:hypothetical protein P171DRAFT_492053 [Karstenula rhodostoma CBS 690.94]|uniref:Uncharacterized protein n=1 Tax=Karstenula rhodostoma CBS 690.94 TaxID=1392251 RepID=A0A9P4P5P5_9PLEO|nr:hypothetical protein P171DRAFT_492053 [Karstenula rhodostoma CBS 690.94]